MHFLNDLTDFAKTFFVVSTKIIKEILTTLSITTIFMKQSTNFGDML